MTNRSWLPLPQSRIHFSLPEHVQVENADKAEISNKRTVVQLWISVPRRSRAERTIILRPQKRGNIWLTEVQAELIDL
ncbi:hypothetical protein MXD81_16865, partial [Microbacteriaceae bacterium K1510]|nr:hypothetical protein [Microbacteriaceae bacterium K1510]